MSTDDGNHDAVARIRRLAKRVRAYQDRYEKANDARAVFAFAYVQITEDRARHIEADDEGFDDLEWLAKLTEAFVERYFLAMDAIDAWLATETPSHPLSYIDLYETTPTPWADAYRALHSRLTWALDALVYGMAAHITHDLPLTLVDVQLETGGRSHVADFHRMNAVLARQIGALKVAVLHRYSRLPHLLERHLGPAGDFLTEEGILLARADAWYSAVRLLDPSARASARWDINVATQQVIDFLQNPHNWGERAMVIGARRLVCAIMGPAIANTPRMPEPWITTSYPRTGSRFPAILYWLVARRRLQGR
jgi:hypothetical protein